MASSVQELVDGLQQMLRDGLNQATTQARDVPGRFSDIVSRALNDAGGAADQLVAIPDNLWNELKESADQPDWLGLLVCLAVHLRDAVGDPPLKVGVWDPGGGWNRAVVLQLTPPSGGGGRSEIRFAIALGDRGTNGFIVRVANAPTFDLAAPPMVITGGATGDGEWRFPINAAGQGPQAGATLRVEITLSRDVMPDSADVIAVGVGRPSISATFTCAAGGTLSWTVDGRFGSAGAPGIRARFDLSPFLGALGDLINVTPIDEHYSPSVRLQAGAGPTFDIGHGGA